MLFNFRKSDKQYSSKKNALSSFRKHYHQQSFSEIAEDHVNSNPYLFETSSDIMDDMILPNEKKDSETDDFV